MTTPTDIDTWPFDQGRDCASLTMRQVIDGDEPILLVSHDDDDHGWQFIGSTDAYEEDGRLVCLEHIVNHDPSVLEIADLPPGWYVIREHVGGPWTKYEAIQAENEVEGEETDDREPQS